MSCDATPLKVSWCTALSTSDSSGSAHCATQAPGFPVLQDTEVRGYLLAQQTTVAVASVVQRSLKVHSNALCTCTCATAKAYQDCQSADLKHGKQPSIARLSHPGVLRDIRAAAYA